MKRIYLPLYGQLKLHVSFSELKLFSECEWKWVLTKLFGVEREPDRSYHMDFGTAVHSGMERMYAKLDPFTPEQAAATMAELTATRSNQT